jgi:hypothetical protein
VYLNSKARELENLIDGKKKMLVRGSMGQKLPYGRVNKADILFFSENKRDL